MAKVLLVEDDNNLREIYEARLQAEGYEIASAQDGEQALVVAKQFKPDLVISDVMMPKISGFEMLDILRNTEGLEHTRVIMLTALGQAEDKTRADSLGADRYLVKSQVTLEDIVKSAHEILDGESAAAATVAAAAPAPESPAIATVPAPEMVAPPVETEQPVTTVTMPDMGVTAAPGAEATTVDMPPAAAPLADAVVPAPTEPIVPTPAVSPEPPVNSSTNVMSAPEEAAASQEVIASTPETPDVVAASQSEAVIEPVPVPAPEEVVTASEAPPAPPQPDSPAVATTPDPYSTAAEKQAINQQIEDFINQPPSAPQAPIAPEQPAEQPVDQLTADDQLLAEAANSLSDDPNAAAIAPSETPPAPASDAPQPHEPAPTPQQIAGDGVTISGKKVIQPLQSSEQKPDLNELLAREQAKEAGLPPSQVATSTAAYDMPELPHQPGQAFTPEQPNDQPQQPQQPTKPDDFDPHDIAL